MSTRLLGSWLLKLICATSFSLAQEQSHQSTSEFGPETVVTSMHLPGEQVQLGTLREDTTDATFDTRSERVKLAELMRPSFALAAEWQASANDVELGFYDARVQVPSYPIFGPPPPMVNAGFSYANIDAPKVHELPTDLYDYSLGFSWIRPIQERWMLRFMSSTALATDSKNNSSDAWQFRGGLFVMYRPSDELTWILGALALGRNDIPVVPAIGAIWKPSAGIRYDVTLPKPRIAFLLVDNGSRQQWGYLAGGFNGGTWAVERSGGFDDQLTYRDWRFVLGWESTRTPEPGIPLARGRKLGVEIGYVFSRKFEFDSAVPDISLGDTLMLRALMSF